MTIFRKAYSVAGAVLMLQFLLQIYFIAAAAVTVLGSNDNAKDVYSSFKTADTFTGLHLLNAGLIYLTLLVMIICSFGARYPWRTTILTAVLLIQLFLQSVFAHTGVPIMAGLHGVNALIMIGLGAYLTGRNWAFGRPAERAASTP
jgi:hypothetical protein